MDKADTGRVRALRRKVAASIVPPIGRLIAERDGLRAEREVLLGQREELRRTRARLNRELVLERRRADEFERHAADLTAATTAGGDVDGERTKLEYLFVASYGRSGSTLVQGVLCSIPGYLIRGENRAALFRLYQFHASLIAAREEFSLRRELDSHDSWFGIDQYAEAAAVTRMRALALETLLRPEPDTRVVGFKEIRWWQREWRGYIDFLRELFPGARFVINTREHAEVAKSLWWGKRPREDVLAQLSSYEQRLNEIAEYLGPDAYRVHYDDYIADHSALKGLFDWLGEPFDAEAVDRVFDVRHSF